MFLQRDLTSPSNTLIRLIKYTAGPRAVNLSIVSVTLFPPQSLNAERVIAAAITFQSPSSTLNRRLISPQTRQLIQLLGWYFVSSAVPAATCPHGGKPLEAGVFSVITPQISWPVSVLPAHHTTLN